MTQNTVSLAISDNEGYSADQVETDITIGSLIEALQEAANEYGNDAKVVLSNGQRYGAGWGRIVSEYGGYPLIEDVNSDEENDW